MILSRAKKFFAAVCLIFAYAGVLALGVCMGMGLLSGYKYGTALIIGRVFGILAAFVIVLQFSLSGRIKILDRVFGFDRLMRFHAFMGPAAAAFAMLHPLFVYSGRGGGLGKLSWELWPEMFGAGAIGLLCVVVVTTLGRKFLELGFQTWLGIHRLAFVIVVAAAIHSIALGVNVGAGEGLVIWCAILTCYGGLFVWAKILKPASLRKNRFIVTHVDQLNHNTWNLRLRPKYGEMFEHIPGQFAFLTLFRKVGKAQEHPFTICSCPNGEYLEFTIKQSGDYTSTIGETLPGDTAAVDGPYGRFSYLRLAKFEHLVLIAGGVGITPLMSCLRHIARSSIEKKITLIWANRTESDIFFKDELAELNGHIPDFEVVHILSDQENYDGYTGRVDTKFLKQVLPPDIKDARVMLCGPPLMMTAVANALKKIGFKSRQINTERFSL